MAVERYRISADIGGTFTDFVVLEVESGRAFAGKLPSTPRSPDRAVLDGLRQLVPDPRAIEFLVHGTTVGLNAFLQRAGARVLLITTARSRFPKARCSRRRNPRRASGTLRLRDC